MKWDLKCLLMNSLIVRKIVSYEYLMKLLYTIGRSPVSLLRCEGEGSSCHPMFHLHLTAFKAVLLKKIVVCKLLKRSTCDAVCGRHLRNSVETLFSKLA